MDSNPYAPPKTAVADKAESMPAVVPPDWLLYSVGQIALATFVGGPAAGGWLIAENYKSLGQPDRARQNFTWSIVGTLVLIGLAFVLPEKYSGGWMAIVPVVVVRSWADAQFRKVLGQHREANGKLYSWWRAFGIGLLSLAALLTVLAALGVVLYFFGIEFE